VSEPSASKQVYRYVDDDGTPVFVSDLEQVPKKHRDGAELLVPDPKQQLQKKAKKALKSEAEKLKKDGVERAKELGAKGLDEASKITKQVAKHVPGAERLDPMSVAVGFIGAFVLVIGFRVVRSSVRAIVKVAVIALIVALLVGGYLGALRQSAGLGGGSAVATPQQVLEDAKKAAAQANERYREQGETLKKIEEGEQ